MGRDAPPAAWMKAAFATRTAASVELRSEAI